MSELELFLTKQKKQKDFLFIPYIALNYPNYDITYLLIKTLFKLGADTIELGLPFTDPVADGPILQTTFHSILQKPFSWKDTLNFIQRLKDNFPDKTFLVMGYANLFHKVGFKNIFEKLYKRNVKGVIIPDIPLEEKEKIEKDENLFSMQDKISWISFITPTTQEERLKRIINNAKGFVYLVSSKGVTGQKTFDTSAIKNLAKAIKKISNIPILIGFGIRTKENVKEVIQISDGFIIGSRLHQIIEELLNQKQEDKIISEIEKEIRNLLPNTQI